MAEASDNKSCGICPHNCIIPEGAFGLCGIRKNSGGKLIPTHYGVVSSIAVDPIEKKPLYRFYPGRPILSIGGYSCNMRCPFCQNHHIATGHNQIDQSKKSSKISPGKIVKMALDVTDNIGVAYTYNEPLINYEFLMDCAKMIRGAGLCNVLVTNGFINPKPLKALLPFIDAANIDLKGFTEDYYADLHGKLSPVMETVALAHKHCHVEVTTLIVPGKNENHIEPLAKWLASLNASIPLHISRFFPRFQYADMSPTPVETIYRLCDAAKKHLMFVYPGNV